MSTGDWIDVSVPISPKLVTWPGDPGIELRRVKDIAEGDDATVTEIKMGAHTGTHIDGPAHYLPGREGVGSMPIDAMLGAARVLEIPADITRIGPGDLRAHRIARGERILLKTANSGRRWMHEPFTPEYVHLSTEGAQYLAEQGIALVGIDYLSVGSPDDGEAVHKALLEAGVWIVEGLFLNDAPPGRCEFVCLPLALADAEGAPARALLRPR